MRTDAFSEKQKMLSGHLYNAFDLELVAERQHAETQLLQINATDDQEERAALLRNWLGSIGEGTIIRSQFCFDYGYNIYLGSNVFINFNCVLLDVMPIRIGDGTQIGPAVQIYAANHPRDHETRFLGLECGKPVTIGRNVWMGGGAIVLPGITIDDNAVIGAGSVVTHNVPSGARVAGNPARILHRGTPQ